MAKKNTTNNEMSTNQKIGVGVGLTAAAVAAAGAYFLYGSENASKNRKAVKSWSLKAKAEVLEKLEDAKKMTREEYDELIAAVAGTYAGVKGATKKDLKDFTAEMMTHWDTLEKSFNKNKKPAKKASAKVAKAAAKGAAVAAASQAVKMAAKPKKKPAPKKAAPKKKPAVKKSTAKKSNGTTKKS